MLLSQRPMIRRTAVLGYLAMLLTGIRPATAVAQPPSPTPSPTSSTVTLITGDTVTLGNPVNGKPTVSVTPAKGPGVGASYTTLYNGGDVYVIPEEVAGLVPGVLDIDLFNVTDLIEMGYDDANAGALPLIVQGPQPFATFDAPGAYRRLPSIDAVAMGVPKTGAADFARKLAAGARAKAAGVTRVWLDRKLEADQLDANLQQIGAPQVWKAGLTGEGVDVAVLDTGVDTDHPDLRGKVTAAVDFTTEGTTVDGNGHGTHVGSIIAGTGAGAAGARQGVAYGARLLSGKVLDSHGTGQDSWLIAGMEWATSHGAEVVNLSLGRAARDGDDSVVQALDALAAETGALFVVAAGNDGQTSGSINSPGVAANALTVGAAGPNGRPAGFSGVGPTKGTFRAKPDLIAPGVEIIGARAGGGTTNSYTSMSGTSQATPHVAGAAALLMQQHPDWDWRRVKSALMTTADPQVAESMSLAQGAGLLDLPGATTETLLLNRGNVDFGYRRYPDGGKPSTIELTLTNTGTEPQTVTFADHAWDWSGKQAPENVVTLSRNAVTVAPASTEHVVATLTPANGEPGQYSGAVTLTRTGSDPTALPLNFFVEPPRHDVRLTVLDRHGRPWVGGRVWLANMQEVWVGGGFQNVRLDENGQATARVAPGPYSMIAKVETPALNGEAATVAFAGSPEVVVDSDISYTIDARKAQRLDPATVEGASTIVSNASIHYARNDAAGTGSIVDAIYATPEQLKAGRVFLQPTQPVRHGTATFETRWRLDAVGDRHGRQADVYELVLGGTRIPDPPIYRISRSQARELATIDADYRSLRGIPETYVETRTALTDRVPSAFVFPRQMQLPLHRVEMVTAQPGVRWKHCVTGPDATRAMLCDPATAYQPRQRLSPTWFRAPAPAVTTGSHSATRIELPIAFSDGEHRGSVMNRAAEGEESLQLFRAGVELPRFGNSYYFDCPPEPATFRLVHSSNPDPDLLPIGRKTNTAWTFPSHAPTDPGQWATTPRLLSVDYQPDTDPQGHVPAGVPLTMGIRLTSTAGIDDSIRVERGTLDFWASTDEQHWHRAIMTPKPDGSFRIVVPGLRPRPGEAVSVHALGKAEIGSIDQTIIDAYPAA